jgi:CRISPR system Cascade subunit CasD
VTGALILRLAGPLQSWGEHSTFSERDSVAFPTRSGLIGLFAGARGLDRGSSLDEYDRLEFTVRIDRPGRRLVDFHTVGGGLPRARTIPTAEGKHRQEGATTLVSNRHYLSDAQFTVAVSSRDGSDLGWLAAALRRPKWAPYLGRRSCVPDQPLLLRDDVTDPLAELLTRVPIPAERYASEGSTRFADLVYETAPQGLGPQDLVYEFRDTPISFAPLARRYSTRRVYRRSEQVTAETYRSGEFERLFRYAKGDAR